MINRTLENKAKPRHELTVTGHQYKLKTTSIFKSKPEEAEFKLNTPFHRNVFEDTKVTSTFTINGNTLTEKNEANGYTGNVKWVFENVDVVVTYTAKNAIATRVFKRVS
jgi:hypothetical protein